MDVWRYHRENSWCLKNRDRTCLPSKVDIEASYTLS